MPTLTRVGAWLVCVVLAPALTGAQELTDAQLIEMILRDGAQARSIRASVEVTRREQAARTAFPNPAIGYSREGAGFTEFLQVEQGFPAFGSRAALSRAGVAAIVSAEAERDAQIWQLRAEAHTLVARLLAEQQKRDVTVSVNRDVERIIDLLRIREKEGEGSRFDRLRAEQELAEARQLSTDAAASVAEARAAITGLLADGPPITRITGVLYQEHTAPELDALNTRAASVRAELRALESSSERYRLEADAARRARLPAPVLAGGLKRADAAERRESGGLLGISVSMPLFDAGRRDAARWVAERARVDAERAFAMQRIRAQITAASEVLTLRQAAVREADAGSPPDELASIAEVAYAEGEAGILELLDAHRTVARAQIRAIEMRLAARLAQIALERAVGETLWP